MGILFARTQRVVFAVILVQLALAATAQARGFEITEPRSGAKVSGSIQFRAKSSNARAVSFYVDGKHRRTDRSRPYSFKIARLSRGAHRLAAVARYRHGKRQRASVKVRVLGGSRAATNAPSVSWRAPTQGQTVRGILSGSTCEARASDTDLHEVRFQLDGREIRVERNAPYNCVWDTTQSSEGSHTLKATAVDWAGNRTSTSISVKVANMAPAPAPSPAPSQPTDGLVWSADFETGNLSQWEGVQQFALSRSSAVTSPRKEGSYAGRFEVRAGEFTFNEDAPTRNRTEAVLSPLKNRHNPQEGSDWWYRWWFYLPSSTPLPANGSTNYMAVLQHITTAPIGDPAWDKVGIMEFRDHKASGDPGPGVVELSYGGTAGAAPFPGPMWGKPASQVTRDAWHEIILRKKWSTNPSVGFVEIWYDGVMQTMKNGSTRVYHANLKPGYSAYLKQGIYRSNVLGGTAVIYLDGLRIGTTRAAVGG